MIDIEEKKRIAAELRSQGYNCSQAVLLPFADELGADEKTLSAVALGLGGGVGGQGEICGVVSALAIAEGLLNGGDPTRKGESYATVRELTSEFSRLNGSLICRELKRPGAAKSCNSLVADGVEILARKINDLRG